MASVKDWCRQSTTTIGTGAITLGNPFVGHVGLQTILSDGATVYYGIINGNDREIGIGTFVSPNILQRTTVLKKLETPNGGGSQVYTENPGTGLSLNGSAEVYSTFNENFFNSYIASSLFIQALSAVSGNGLIAKTGTGSAATRTITASTDFTITNANGVNGNPYISLTPSGVTPGWYTKFQVDANGRIISATAPTNIATLGITDAVSLTGTEILTNKTITAATFSGISNSDININTGYGFKVGAYKVVGDRDAGWGTISGSTTKTGFNTSNATTGELAQHLGALINTLKVHGLIGT